MLKHRQLQKWFPDSDIVVLPPAAITPQVTDEGARAVLTEAGMPENLYDVLDLHSRLSVAVTTIGEAYAQQDAQAPANTEALLYLGFAGQRFLALNGQSGEVLQVHDDFGARPFAPGLESFVRALGAVNNRVRKSLKKGRTSSVEQLLAEVSKEFPLADAEHAWRDFLADIVASAE
ncbi:hypothetical protein Vqi01_19830 [Micromonospora qiuiae]|uniref:SUKH-4 immunity protein n=1 Tax=Micromonospora qiuiae TaxID=502268 RepID=A0ABQ4J9H8_9ACTN|nr:SUKH-4 family immunity protein [Micromonospora qiuiae]GIJ26821.1 hypothetical protein Vqi01_19830 [Micromonospora qiuiae]